MKIEGSFLQSKVARRVFALFVLTALIPVAFISVFSHYQVTRLLTEQTQQRDRAIRLRRRGGREHVDGHRVARR
ncbi:MAG: hypothetical protein ABL952_18270, partial [Pyrinomonadaceae bacterium]